MPRVRISLEDAIEKAQNVADLVNAKVKSLGYYLSIIEVETGHSFSSLESVISKLDSIYNELEDLLEE